MGRAAELRYRIRLPISFCCRFARCGSRPIMSFALLAATDNEAAGWQNLHDEAGFDLKANIFRQTYSPVSFLAFVK